MGKGYVKELRHACAGEVGRCAEGENAIVSGIVSLATKNEARWVHLGPFRRIKKCGKSLWAQMSPHKSLWIKQMYSLPPLATWVSYRASSGAVAATPGSGIKPNSLPWLKLKTC